LFAPNRLKRANNFYVQKAKVDDPSKCPFCPGNEHLTPKEIFKINAQENKWQLRVVPNLYNLLSTDEELKYEKEMFFDNISGVGAHEIVIETPKHDCNMYDFSVLEFITYFEALKNRIEDLKNDTRLKYISVFKNSGFLAGATQTHSHTQIVATPFIPKSVQEDINYFKSYYEEHKRNFFDDLIYEEKIFKKGILFENESFIAFAPYASSFAFEVQVISKKELLCLKYFNSKDLESLSMIMKDTFELLHNGLGEFSFNMLVKNSFGYEDVCDADKRIKYNRFYIQIIPRNAMLAGFELDSQMFVNPVLPETAVKIMKETL
jgi:UDPglucose--hexose-1-phosphate uridylyltransferase